MDGRLQRSEQNRRSIVKAALELVAELGDMPTAQAIADRAGLAKRSVYHHFPDLETLFGDAAHHQQQEAWTLLSRPDRSQPFEVRLAAATEQRARLFEEIGAVRRVAARHEMSSVTLQEQMHRSRRALRLHIANHLKPELDDLEPPVVEGVHAVASFEAWEVLRHQQRLSFSEAGNSVRSTIRAVMAPALVR
jgi:TetR/AcrR family transcriptional regulator of autoinduction and epiphytic fitness